jgi:hypothetical protein
LRRQGIFIAAAIAAIALVYAGIAVAGGGITIVTKDQPNSNTGTVVRPMAHCAPGQHVLGGGFSDFQAGGLAQRDKPIHDSGWRVVFLPFSSGGQGNATAYALCEAASARNVKVVHKQVTIPAGGGTGPGASAEKGVTVSCPKGMEVLSGGYSARPRYKPIPLKGTPGPQGEVSIDTDKRSGPGSWYVHAGNDGAPNDLAAFALCQPQGTSDVTQVSDTQVVTGPGVEADATCPDGSHLVGGGFRMRPNEQNGGFPIVNASFPSNPTNWVALADIGVIGKHSSSWNKRGTTQPPSLTSYAECEA